MDWINDTMVDDDIMTWSMSACWMIALTYPMVGMYSTENSFCVYRNRRLLLPAPDEQAMIMICKWVGFERNDRHDWLMDGWIYIWWNRKISMGYIVLFICLTCWYRSSWLLCYIWWMNHTRISQGKQTNDCWFRHSSQLAKDNKQPLAIVLLSNMLFTVFSS